MTQKHKNKKLSRCSDQQLKKSVLPTHFYLCISLNLWDEAGRDGSLLT